MSAGPTLRIQQNTSGEFEVDLPDGSKVTCGTQVDAELVLDAARRFYEGNTDRKLPRKTIAALERAGLSAANSVLYRSATHNLTEE